VFLLKRVWHTALILLLFFRKKKVPDVLFTTIDPPKEVPVVSHGALIQAR
jgi:hypothetical protein